MHHSLYGITHLKQTAMLFFALYMLLASSIAHASDAKLKGALCYIQADNQVVFIQEVITGLYSLPGGTIEAGESPKVAAERETWEESGLVVNAKALLTKTKTAYIYDCEVESPIFVYHHQNKRGFHFVPAWFAPSYGLETQSVFLSLPENISAKEYRFPEQWKQQVFGHKVHNQDVQYIYNTVSSAPYVQSIEISFIETIQNSILNLDNAFSRGFVWVMLLLDSFSSIFMVLLVLPLINYLFGAKFSIRLCLIIIVTAVIVYFIQLRLQLPRPEAYFPDIHMSNKTGFGMPSLSATLSMVWLCYVFNALVRRYKEFYPYKVLLLLVLFIVCKDLATVWLGGHFFSDILCGYALGILIAWHYIRLENNKNIHVLNVMVNPIFWWLLTLCLHGLVWFSHALIIGQLAAMALAISLLLSVNFKRSIFDGFFSPKVQITLVSIVAVGGIIFAPQIIDSVSNSSMMTYLTKCAVVFFLTLNAMLLGRIKPHANASNINLGIYL